MIRELLKVSLTLILSLLFHAAALAQTAVHGMVVDQGGEPVIGASVLVENAKTATGTVTDIEGRFSLSVSPGTMLRVTYLGYEPVSVPAKDGMRVTLEENSTQLNGVEVVAYGVQKKLTVTGAVSSVKTDDLTRTPVSSVNNILAGQLSGVTTVQYSGARSRHVGRFSTAHTG